MTNYKMVKDALGNVTRYESELKTLSFEAPEFIGEQGNKYLPTYIILKHNKDFNAFRINEKITKEIITCENDIYSEYRPIWTGSKTLKEAKEHIEDFINFGWEG